MPPLAITARRGSITAARCGGFINWFGIMTFGLAVFLMAGLCRDCGWPAKLAERSAISALITPQASALCYNWWWRYKFAGVAVGDYPQTYPRPLQAVTSGPPAWHPVGAVDDAVLPWLDAAKSYRRVVAPMDAALPADVRNGSACISVAAQAHTARFRQAQYSPLDLKTDDAGCAYRLVRIPRESAAPAGWRHCVAGRATRNKRC